MMTTSTSRVFCLVIFVLLLLIEIVGVVGKSTTTTDACADDGTKSATCSASSISVIGGIQQCIADAFPDCASQLVTIDSVPKCTYYYDGDDYTKARMSVHGDMLPYVLIYAESEEDAVKAVNCAAANGMQVTARGRGHDYQGLSAAHGHVVVDMSLTCNPDEFVIDRTGGEHILPGQRYLATMQVQPGCTNAVLLSAVHKYFDPEEGALALIGACPSVGLTGFTLGGGSGDVAPYTGWSADLLQEARVILDNGTVVTASADENPDLFWALRGGGSGNGIVSSLTLRIVESPAPTDESTARNFTRVSISYDTDKRREFFEAFQNFLYDVDPAISSKFGGSATLRPDDLTLSGVYLGSWNEFIDDFHAVGLLDDKLYNTDAATTYVVNYNGPRICGPADEGYSSLCDVDGLPPKGVSIWQFDSFVEAEMYNICTNGDIIRNPSTVRSSNDWCADLDIDSVYCVEFSISDYLPVALPGITQESIQLLNLNASDTISLPKDCYNPVVINALLEKAYDPESFLNRHGYSPYWADLLSPLLPFVGYPSNFAEGSSLGLLTTSVGSTMPPKLDVETLVDLSSNPGFVANHLNHGAPLTVPTNATAFPWRNSAMLLDFTSETMEYKDTFISRLVQDPYYDNNATKLQAYYNYLGPYTPAWRYLV